ncbi:MAG: hypothetical protein J0L62_02650, partial [Bacteroidetes bacterium]|nr:hypothetical protein [Bacteroidota bacterium]
KDARIQLESDLKELAGDSLSLSVRYFGESVSDIPFDLKSWRYETRFAPVLDQSKEGYNLVITDGVFSDYDWLPVKPAGKWDAMILGDTTKVAGFRLLNLVQPEITGYESDVVTLPFITTWSGIKTDSAKAELRFSDDSQTFSIRPAQSSGSVSLSGKVTLPGPGEYSYQVKLATKTGVQQRNGKIIVLKRLQNIIIASNSPDPLAGFLKRQFESLGKLNVQVVIDDPERKPKAFSSVKSVTDPVLHIWLNYPQKPAGLVPPLLRKQDPFLLISSLKPDVAQLPSELSVWMDAPAQLAGQGWYPSPVSLGSSLLWSGWTATRFNELPPLISPVLSFPLLPQRQISATLRIRDQNFDIPVQSVISEKPKRIWMAYGAFDQWERWQAVNGQTVPAVSSDFRQFLTWMLTPTDEDLVAVRFRNDPVSRELVVTGLIQSPLLQTEPDSLRLDFGWKNGDLQKMEVLENGWFEVRLPVPDSLESSWTLSVTRSGSSPVFQSGRYRKPPENEEKEVESAELDPLSPWIAGHGGKTWVGIPPLDSIRLQLGKTGQLNWHQTSHDAWKSLTWFLLIIAFLTIEWIIRKRFGAL